MSPFSLIFTIICWVLSHYFLMSLLWVRFVYFSLQCLGVFSEGLDDDIHFDRLLFLDLSPVNPTRCIIFSLSRPWQKRSRFVMNSIFKSPRRGSWSVESIVIHKTPAPLSSWGYRFCNDIQLLLVHWLECCRVFRKRGSSFVLLWCVDQMAISTLEYGLS